MKTARPRFAAKLSTRLFVIVAACTLVASIFGATAYMRQRQAAAPQPPPAPAERIGKLTMRQEVKEAEGKEEAAPDVPEINGPEATSNYVFTTATDGSLTDMTTGTMTLVPANTDDTASGLTVFPFDFYFQGVRHSSFSVNENGVLRLSVSAQTGAPYKPLAQAGLPILTAYGADQRTHTTGKVHAKTTGTAPNRVLIVEWLNNQSNFDLAGTADLTYQIRLFETTGVIQYVYGKATMSTLGAASTNSRDPNIGFSSSNTAGTVGSVTAAQSGTPAPTFNGGSATPVANLYTAGVIPALNSAADGSRRVFTFTPPTPNAPTNLTFTAVAPSSYTLNWADSADETIYAIYRSTDGTNYTFQNTAAQNATTFAATGLTPSTNYFWQVFAVSEGAFSSALAGSQATAAPGNIMSTAAGGNWSSTLTWVGGVVPTASDNVTITDAATVTIDTAANAFSVSVGTGLVAPTTLQYEVTTARTLTVATNVTVASNGTFRSATTGTVITHALSLGGNLTNNGVLDFSTSGNLAAAGITFTGAANNTFGGTGATTDVRTITLNKGASNANILELNPTNFTARGITTDTTTTTFLTLTNGTFKISGTFTASFRMFSVNGYTIPATAGVWLNNPNYTVVGLGGSPTNAGLLRITQGTYNVGTGSGNSMDGSAGAVFIIEGGTLNTTGRFSPQSAVTYTQSSGTVNVNNGGNAANDFGSFELFSAGAVFNMSGGTINLVQACTAATTPVDYRVNGTANVTGGTLNVGTAATVTNFNFRIRGNVPNVVINNTTNNKTATVTAQVVVFGDTTVSPGTTLNLNGFLFAQRGANLFNNGTILGNTAGSRLYFAGSAAQLYGGSGVAGTNAAPLQAIDFDSAGGVTFQAGTVNNLITNTIRLFTGNVTNSNKLTLGAGGTTTGTIQVGNTTTPTNAGSFDVPPVFNLGTGGQVISYLRETNPRTTGNGINPARSLTQLTYDNNVAGVNNLTIAGGDLTVTGALALTNGTVTTGINTLVSGPAGTVTRTTGYVIGRLRQTLAGTTPKTFAVGTANNFSPVVITPTAGTGDMVVSATQGKLPAISGANALARYWTLTPIGAATLFANLQFFYNAADVVGTEANYQFVKNNAGTLSVITPTTLDTGTHIATLNGVNSFSDWTLAEPAAVQSGTLQLSSATYADSETNADHTFNVPVTRTGGSDGAASVTYNVTNGTATVADNDYTVSPSTGTLNWAAGDMADKNIPVTVKGDTTNEPNETVNISITGPTGSAALGSPAAAVLTITNDDPPATPAAIVYVDDDFTGAYGSDPDGAGPATFIGYDAFATIQGGATGVAGGGTVNVAAGTYTENVTIAKPLTLTGAGEAVVTQRPALSSPNCGGGPGGSLCAGSSNLLLVQADNVTVSGLTLDGDNPALTSGVVRGGADLDARNGVITNHTAGTFNNLEVHHATIKNIYLRGMYASSTGSFNFHDTTVQNVQGEAASIGLFNFGGAGAFTNNTVSECNDAIASNHSRGTTYTGNTVTTSASGIHTDNAGDSGGTPDTISGNTVTNSQQFGYGIWTFVPANLVTVTDNTVTNVEVGLAAAGGQGGSSTFTGNNVDGQSRANATGVYLTTDQFGFGQGNNSVLFQSNTVRNNVDGFFLEANSDGSAPQRANGRTLPASANADAAERGTSAPKRPAAPSAVFTLTVAADFNRVVGNSSTGISKVGAGVLNLNFENNWWGCNAGPNQTGCQTVDAAADFAPWLVLTVTASPNPITPGAASTVTADLRHNSDGAIPSSTAFVPPTPVAFAATNGTITPPGATTANGDAAATFTSTSASSGTASATVDNQTTATNVNVTAPAFSIDDVTHAEGDSGTTDYTFTITKTGSTAFNSTVDYATVDGTATSPSDFAALPATTLTFLPGETSKQFTVLVNGDTTVEPDEAFTARLSNASGATISDPDGTGAIENDDTAAPPNVVYVDDDWVGLSNGTDPDGGGPATSIGYDAFATIQGGVGGVANGGTVNVASGTYDEDVNVNKFVSLLGTQGAGTTNVRGPVGGSATTIQITASNVTVAGFTVTRLGNNTTDWNNPGLNTAGFAIQGQAVTAALIRDNIITGNRTGLDINNSNGHTVRNNVIDFNRTGFLYRNQTDNQTVVENFITNNWTVGVLFIDGSGGTNVPAQSALHSTFSNNNISANWYGQIADRQTGGSLPAPGTTNLKNFRNNWFGTTSPVVTTANTAEPGYAAQIPVAYGGTATPPGGQPDIAGPASANFKYQPFLQSGTDTNVETTPGRGTNGFQGVQSLVVVTPANQQGWVFFDDFPGTGTGTGGFEHGPATPPLGAGSAFLQVDSQGRHAFATAGYGGTRMDDVTNLSYGSYQDNNANTTVAISFQFDIDYDLGDASNTFMGRLVFEPYLSPEQGAVQQNVWQNWDALAGKWYGTRSTVTVNNTGGVSQPCQPATPCTWQQVIALFPNAGVRNTATSAVLFKAGGPWSPGFDGNVDNFRIAVSAANTTYDFEPLPRLSIGDVTLAEGDAGQTAFTFTVTLSRAFDQTVTVDYATADSTAAAPSDYTAHPTTQLVFAPGETSKQVTVQVNGDAAFEADEQFFVNLSNVSATATILDAQGVGTITNDDAAQNGTVQFGAAAYAVNEGVASVTITVTRTGGADQAAGVTYATGDGTATAGQDYTAAGGTLNWAAGDSAPKTFTVPVTNDAAAEPNETVILTLSAATGATLGTPNPATLNIFDNDGAASTNIVVVYPTALQGWDFFNQATATGAFANGPGTPPYGSGSYHMTTGAGTGGAGAGGKHWLKTNSYNGTRLDAISQVSYRTYVDPTSTANASLAPVLEMMVDADGNGTRDTTLVFEPIYTPEQNTITKGVWQTWNARTGRWRSTATVGPIVPNTYFTLDVFFAAHPNAAVVQWYPRADGFGFGTSVGQNTGGDWANFVGAVDGIEFGSNNASTLNDFELAPPAVSVGDVTLAEGDTGTTSFTFNVTLSGPSSIAVTVDYTTQDGTATVTGGDYAANSGTLTFAAGETSKPVTVLVTGDTAYEANETFNVQLSNPTGGAGATISDADGAGTINNDDAAVSGSIEFVSNAYNVNEPDGPAQITVRRTGGTDGQATAAFSTSDGSATAGADYTAVTGQTVTFAHGEGGMKTVDVPVSDDSLYEGDETVNLSLTTTTITLGPNAVSPLAAVLTITDDETVPTVSVSSPVYVSEPATGTASATFTFTLSGAVGAPVTLDYQTQDGTATAPDDYTAVPSTQLTFAAGQTTRTVTVDVKADAVNENSEDFTLTLSNVSANATLASTTATGIITDFVPAGGVLISELRLRGAGGATDEYVELYNNTDSAITVGASDGSAGWALAALSADGLSAVVLHTIPAGTGIPARSYYLVANDPAGGTGASGFTPVGYSLGAYAAPDATYATDVPDASGVALFRTADTAAFSLATRFDAAGFTSAVGALPDLFREGTPLASPGATGGEYAFFRTLTSGRPADTDNNAADFTFVSTDAGTYGGVPSKLGAPGPQNARGPIVRTNSIKAGLIDPGCGGSSLIPGNACARYRDLTPDPSNNSTFGTLSIRRKFVNITAEPVTRLRFRVVDVTTGAAPVGTADVRLRTSPTFAATPSGGGTTTIQGLTLETPPAQGEGGGFNSTVAAGTITLATPLAAGNSVNVHFLLGLEQTGTFRFFVNIEALKMSEESTAPSPGAGARRKLPRPDPQK